MQLSCHSKLILTTGWRWKRTYIHIYLLRQHGWMTNDDQQIRITKNVNKNPSGTIKPNEFARAFLAEWKQCNFFGGKHKMDQPIWILFNWIQCYNGERHQTHFCLRSCESAILHSKSTTQVFCCHAKISFFFFFLPFFRLFFIHSLLFSRSKFIIHKTHHQISISISSCE